MTAKRFPGDYDGAWDPSGVDPSLIDPVLLNFENKRAAMKAKYLGELFPAVWNAEPGVPFTEFFQRDRDGRMGSRVPDPPSGVVDGLEPGHGHGPG